MEIKTTDLPGPPYTCPECKIQGKTTQFPQRGQMGTHRFSAHQVIGLTRKKNNLNLNPARRTYTKRTVEPEPNISPLFSLLENPQKAINEIDAAVSDVRDQLNNLVKQTGVLNEKLATLQNFRTAVSQLITKEETTAPFYAGAHTA